MSIQDIPLNKLSLSPQNVRPETADDPGILELAASIRFHGLQQNLVVTPKNKRDKTFAVIAGGRRLAALQSLAANKHLASDAPISCRVETDKSKASELSLAENELRLNMSVTETCAAFKALIDGGKKFEDIATSFGVTVRFVKQRIALASLAPPVFDALACGKITLDVAQAFANCPDHDRQTQVFEDNPWNLSNAALISRQLQDTAASGSSRFAQYVGAEAYIAAGGIVTQQLFEEDTLFVDAAKLEQMAMEKISNEVSDLAKQRGIADILALPDTYTPYQLDGYVRLYPETREATEEEAAYIDALEIELEDLHDKASCEDLKAQAVAAAVIKNDGTVQVDDTLFIPRALAKTAGQNTRGGGSDEDGETSARPESAKLLYELAEHRALILAAGLAQAPALAQDLGRLELIVSVVTNLPMPNAFALKARPMDRRHNVDLSGTISGISLRTSLDQLDAAWIQADTYGEMFEAFRDLPEAEKVAWFAFAVAHSVQPVVTGSYHRSADQMQARVFKLLGMEECEW